MLFLQILSKIHLTSLCLELRVTISFIQCVVPKKKKQKKKTPPQRFVNWTLPLVLKFHFPFIFSFKNFGCWDPPPLPPWNFKCHSLGWVWISWSSTSNLPTCLNSAERNNRELKQRQRRWQQRHCKTIGLMSKNNRSVHDFTFWFISLLSSAKQQHEMITFKVLWRTWMHGGKFFSFSFLTCTPLLPIWFLDSSTLL